MKTVIKKIINSATGSIKRRASIRINNAVAALPFNKGITLVDIGAAGDIEPRWKTIESYINYVGFEPDERSRLILLSKKTECRNYELLPFVLGDRSGSVALNLCRKPQVSSIYLPNQKFIKLFSDSKRFDILKTETLKTKCLDDVEIESPDFFKLDIQGGELNALKGGVSTIKDLVGLEIEVEFMQLYLNQPLFGEITEFLSNNGFEFIDFVDLCRWNRENYTGFGQCVFGDALFLKSPEVFFDASPSKEKMCSYFAVLLLYRRFDLIDKTFEYLLPAQLSEYSAFINALIPIRKSHETVRKINGLFNRFVSLFNTGYRSHIIY